MILNLELPTESKIDLLETVEVLFYKTNEPLYLKLREYNINFLNPLVIAYLNTPKSKAKLSFEKDLNSYNQYLNSTCEYLNKDFVLYKNIPEFMDYFFFESYRGQVLNQNPEYNSTYGNHNKDLVKALEIISKHLPDFYEQLVCSNNSVFTHDNTKIINFASKKAHGFLSFNTLPENNEVYFIEEFIHQGSHSFLNLVFHNKDIWFLKDVEHVKMSQITPNKNDYRSLFSFIHGLYTVGNRIKCFDVLLRDNIFSDEKKHELFGRMADQVTRFMKGGYDMVDLKEYLTLKGIQFYATLYLKTRDLAHEYSFLLNHFDLSNRDVDFRYHDFCNLNPYNTFVLKEKEGVFDCVLIEEN